MQKHQAIRTHSAHSLAVVQDPYYESYLWSGRRKDPNSFEQISKTCGFFNIKMLSYIMIILFYLLGILITENCLSWGTIINPMLLTHL